jgi:hypothetical protein
VTPSPLRGEGWPARHVYRWAGGDEGECIDDSTPHPNPLPAGEREYNGYKIYLTVYYDGNKRLKRLGPDKD